MAPVSRSQGLVWPRYTAAWLGGPLIGIANGAVRERLYAKRVGEQRSHQISTVTAITLFAIYFSALERRWPIPSDREALAIGATWTTLTVGFEFGFGHFVAGQPIPELLRDYNLAKGRLWPLVLVWLALGPVSIRRLRRLRAAM